MQVVELRRTAKKRDKTAFPYFTQQQREEEEEEEEGEAAPEEDAAGRLSCESEEEGTFQPPNKRGNGFFE